MIILLIVLSLLACVSRYYILLGLTTDHRVVFCRWVLVMLSLFLVPLYCLSFSCYHCIVCPFLGTIVLSVLFLLPLYCLSFSCYHCIVCPFLGTIVLSVLLTTDHRQLHNDDYEEFDNTKRVTINRKKDKQYNGTKKRDKQYNGTKKRTNDN
jgi:hypothetical protein